MVAKLTEWAFRTPLNRQNLRCRVVGENHSSENGAIMYDCVEFEDYLGNVGILGGTPFIILTPSLAYNESEPFWPI